MVDPRYGNRMVLGSGSALFRTEDGGNVWSNWFEWGSGWTVYEIEQGLNDPNHWYAVVRSNNTCKLFKTSNDGNSWSQLTSGSFELGQHGIAVNPRNANEIFAMHAGGTSVYRSTTGDLLVDVTDAMWSANRTERFWRWVAEGWHCSPAWGLLV